MDLGIEDRVAVITGASSGIGLATAELLVHERCRLLLTDNDGVDWGPCEQAMLDVGGPSGAYRIVAGDLTKQSDCDNVCDVAVNEFGTLDIVVHTAGVTGAKGDPLKMTDQDYWDAYDIDFMSAVRMARASIPIMRESKWGRFVCITSENASQPYWEEAVYNTAKAALACFVKGISRSEAQHGVLVNSVAPAFIETPMTDQMMQKRADKQNVELDQAVQSFLKEERPSIAMARRGQPEEVAAVIALLVSDRASFINGSNYRVDGGSVQTVDN